MPPYIRGDFIEMTLELRFPGAQAFEEGAGGLGGVADAGVGDEDPAGL
jgi:hypothetical protein